MGRLVKRCGNNPAVPTGFDLDFIFDLADKENEGLQAVFDRLCELEEKIEKGELLEVVRCKDCKFCKTFYPAKEIDKEPIQVWFCKAFRFTCKQDGFCSYGERREGE